MMNLIEKIEPILNEVNKVLNFELWKLNDNTSITVLKVFLFCSFIYVGCKYLRKISDTVFGKLASIFDVKGSFKNTLQALGFYIFLTLFIFVILDIANIPMTTFAFLGGALAIGIGFGSQNILNNFISGIILLLERPVKIGDILEIDGTRGTVRSIGMRCTKIQSFNNISMLIPNSKLLENKVVNLTLDDQAIRREIDIGCSYRVAPKKVIKILEGVILSNPDIEKDPKPYVAFDSFGDSSLNYKIFFWANLNGARKVTLIESDIKSEIYDVLERNHISIPFPQRDVHIHHTKEEDTEEVSKKA